MQQTADTPNPTQLQKIKGKVQNVSMPDIRNDRGITRRDITVEIDVFSMIQKVERVEQEHREKGRQVHSARAVKAEARLPTSREHIRISKSGRVR